MISPRFQMIPAVMGFGLCLLTACANPTASETDAAEAPPQIQTEDTKPTQQFILETNQPVVSLAAIPATAHLGKSHIVAAHGANGFTIRDTDGTVLWTIDAPARLVAHYQGLLVVYSQDEAGTSTLERYRLDTQNGPTLVETASPSPIAATTLQRTAIASLGPVQISGSELIIGENIVSAPGPITAVASASYFPPLISGKTLLIATENGDIIIQSNNLPKD